MVMHVQAADERMAAEMREHGIEEQPPNTAIGEEYAPDEAWQRALAEKRRLLASRPRSN